MDTPAAAIARSAPIERVAGPEHAATPVPAPGLLARLFAAVRALF